MLSLQGWTGLNHDRTLPQLGLVCANLEAAMQSWSGADDGGAFLTLDVAASMNAPDAPVSRIGLAFAGEVNIELIELVPTTASIYSPALEPVAGFRFHHHGYLVDDDYSWEVLNQRSGDGPPVAMKGEVPGVLRYMYVDRRAELGHYVEYIRPFEARRSLFAGVPRCRLEALGMHRRSIRRR